MNKEVRKLVTALSVIPEVEVVQGGKHLQVYKRGQRICSLPSTPSDHRWYNNTLATLRRAGITPGVRPDTNGTLEITSARSTEQLRHALGFYAAAGSLPELGRFVHQYGDVNGLKNYSSAKSAENSIRRLLQGGKLNEWTRLLLDRAISARRALDAALEAPEPDEPVAAVDSEVAEPQLLTVAVDLDRVNEILAGFGIRIVTS